MYVDALKSGPRHDTGEEQPRFFHMQPLRGLEGTFAKVQGLPLHRYDDPRQHLHSILEI
jgi:hypothetical protein